MLHCINAWLEDGIKNCRSAVSLDEEAVDSSKAERHQDLSGQRQVIHHGRK